MSDLEPITTPAAELPLDTPPAAPKKRNRSTGRPPGRPRKDSTPAADTPVKGRPSKNAQRAAQYTKSLGKVGALLYLVNRADGEAFLQGVPATAKALANVADNNPTIAKVLDAGASAGVWLELAAAIGGIAVPIACNHGVLPPYIGALLAGDLDSFMATAPEPPAPVVESDGAVVTDGPVVVVVESGAVVAAGG